MSALSCYGAYCIRLPSRANPARGKYSANVQAAHGITVVVWGELEGTDQRFFEVDERTIERYLEKSGDELGRNDYEVIHGNRLNLFKMTIEDQFVPDIHAGSKTTQLGIFDFRAFLNLPCCCEQD